MTAINKIITQSKCNFENWERQLGEHLLLQGEPETNGDEADRERIFFQTNDLLFSIAENFFSYAKFKDRWDTSNCFMFPFGQYISLKSEKMDISFNWGVELNDFYLETYVNHSENLRFMSDDFWAILLELKGIGDFEYSGGGGLNIQQKPYFENKTSVIFQIIRTFMLNQTDRMHDGNTQWEFGSLVLKWKMDNNWSSLLECACKAFRLMYQLNYQLWKVYDLTKKK
ncbi:MAG: hypothetical protein L0G39_21835 [Chryseobacterium sp.]|nr:hypothetical protein [Chryseobacterium sp.]MDN5479576.1 hypothetical protein [Chryseobacterium sp.]